MFVLETTLCTLVAVSSERGPGACLLVPVEDSALRSDLSSQSVLLPVRSQSAWIWLPRQSEPDLVILRH